MSEQLRESLSAAMDDQADAFELRRVLDEAAADDELRDQWHRFHLMRSLMRNDVGAFDPTALRGRIWQALHESAEASEDEVESPGLIVPEQQVSKPAPRSASWMGRWAAGGIAVAVAVVVGIAGGVFDSEVAAPSLASQSQPARLGPVAAQPVTASAAEQLDRAQIAPVMYYRATQADFERQHGLMLRHIQYRAMNQPTVASFVKMATFRSRSSVPAWPVEADGAEPSASP